jgi:hypothetical protein
MNTLKTKGFTVIETMIFLAVSGFIFISVALMISGQLDRYQSRDAVNQVESVMRGVLNDVSNGYFPLVGKKVVSCVAVPGGRPTVNIEAVGTGENRGTQNADVVTGNAGCILAGKSIEFRNNYILIQTLVANGDLNNIPSTTELREIPELEETKELKWGMTHEAPDQKYYILYKNLTVTDYAGKFVSGSQDVSIYVATPTIMVDVTNAANNNKICFNNGDHQSSLKIADYSLTIEANYVGCM